MVVNLVELVVTQYYQVVPPSARRYSVIDLPTRFLALLLFGHNVLVL